MIESVVIVGVVKKYSDKYEWVKKRTSPFGDKLTKCEEHSKVDEFKTTPLWGVIMKNKDCYDNCHTLKINLKEEEILKILKKNIKTLEDNFTKTLQKRENLKIELFKTSKSFEDENSKLSNKGPINKLIENSRKTYINNKDAIRHIDFLESKLIGTQNNQMIETLRNRVSQLSSTLKITESHIQKYYEIIIISLYLHFKVSERNENWNSTLKKLLEYKSNITIENQTYNEIFINYKASIFEDTEEDNKIQIIDTKTVFQSSCVDEKGKVNNNSFSPKEKEVVVFGGGNLKEQPTRGSLFGTITTKSVNRNLVDRSMFGTTNN